MKRQPLNPEIGATSLEERRDGAGGEPEAPFSPDLESPLGEWHLPPFVVFAVSQDCYSADYFGRAGYLTSPHPGLERPNDYLGHGSIGVGQLRDFPFTGDPLPGLPVLGPPKPLKRVLG